MTDFVPYIDKDWSLFLLENKEYITGFDNNKSKLYNVQNLLTEVTFDDKYTKRQFVEKFIIGGKIKCKYTQQKSYYLS